MGCKTSPVPIPRHSLSKSIGPYKFLLNNFSYVLPLLLEDR